MSLTSSLTAVRNALLNDTDIVILRPTQVRAVEYPESGLYIVIDLIGGSPQLGMDGRIYDDLLVQVSCWSSNSLTEATALLEAARDRLKTELDIDRAGRVELDMDDKWAVARADFRDPAAFEEI